MFTSDWKRTSISDSPPNKFLQRNEYLKDS